MVLSAYVTERETMSMNVPLFFSEFESEREQMLLTSLLQRSQLYTQTNSYRELLEFINRLPHIAPFNGLLLNIQKPGLRFAAFERDWLSIFGRTIWEGARPLVILWPFGPVAFVYDIEDTEGAPLPVDVTQAFRATGSIDCVAMSAFEYRVRSRGIYVTFVDYGDGQAGKITAEGLSRLRVSPWTARSAHLPHSCQLPIQS